MGRPHGRARSAVKSSVERAQEAREAFVGKIRELLAAKAADKEVTRQSFQAALLWMLSTAELAKSSPSIHITSSYKNLLERQPDTYQQLADHLMMELESGSGATIILGSIRGKARELGVTI